MIDPLENNDVIARIGPPGDVQIFSLDEAREVLPILIKLTHAAVQALEPVQGRLRRTLPCDPRLPKIELEYERQVRRWIGKVERLGLVARGLWWIDIDVGEGFMCWKYPEIRLDYFHAYNEKPGERRKLSDHSPFFDSELLH